MDKYVVITLKKPQRYFLISTETVSLVRTKKLLENQIYGNR